MAVQRTACRLQPCRYVYTAQTKSQHWSQKRYGNGSAFRLEICSLRWHADVTLLFFFSFLLFLSGKVHFQGLSALWSTAIRHFCSQARFLAVDILPNFRVGVSWFPVCGSCLRPELLCSALTELWVAVFSLIVDWRPVTEIFEGLKLNFIFLRAV